MKTARIAIAIFLLGCLTACRATPPEPVLTLEKAWVRAMPPGSNMTAAYGIFTNNGKQVIEISEFGSDSYGEASLHMTVVDAGISRMIHVPAKQMEPAASLVLEPGGYHLMLMKPTREIHPGDRIGLTLIATSWEKFEFSLPVEAR